MHFKRSTDGCSLQYHKGCFNSIYTEQRLGSDRSNAANIFSFNRTKRGEEVDDYNVAQTLTNVGPSPWSKAHFQDLDLKNLPVEKHGEDWPHV